MQHIIEQTMSRARGGVKPISAARPTGVVWRDRNPDYPLRLEHPLPQVQERERVAELMQHWSPEQQARYDTYDPERWGPDSGHYEDWPDVSPHLRRATAREADERWTNLNRHGIWIDTRMAWSLWDPQRPLLCILTFPHDETCQFLHRTPSQYITNVACVLMLR